MEVFENMPVYTSYKDRVFRKLLSDKGRLLEVYNALNDTHYEDEGLLEITTMEGVIFIKMKNDVSFILDSDMCLYEHQSTYCPNMPLRGFLYFADLYRKYTRNIELSVRRLIKIPTPHYIVFYNGTERDEEEFCQLLSDAYADDSEGCIELKVRTININYGHNKKLLGKSKTLSDYSFFVACIRKHLRNKTLKRAVVAAVNECISKDVLGEFLQEYKAEVIAMSIYEYNEEYARKAFYEDGQEDGYKRGIEQGMKRGKLMLIIPLILDGIISKEEAAVRMGISLEQLEAEMNHNKELPMETFTKV